METLSSHHARLLGLDDSWRVEPIDLQLEDRRVEIRLSHVGSGVICPECGGACGLADHAEERRFDAIKKHCLKTARARAITDLFRWFWRHVYSTSARRFFMRWYAWAVRCRLRPVVKVARMLRRHLPNLLTYFLCPNTNATTEGYNSVIQALKYEARGFRSFANYRTRILFFCGKLDLRPRLPCH